jgi:hypothetical protein
MLYIKVRRENNVDLALNCHCPINGFQPLVEFYKRFSLLALGIKPYDVNELTSPYRSKYFINELESK